MALSYREKEQQRERAWIHGEEGNRYLQSAENAVRRGEIAKAIEFYEGAARCYKFAVERCRSGGYNPTAIKDIVSNFQAHYEKCSRIVEELKQDIPNFVKLKEKLNKRNY